MNPPRIKYDPREEKIRVWLIEDNEIFSETVVNLLNRTSGFTCEQAFSNCEDMLEHLESEISPDVVLADIGLPGMSGIEGVERIKSISPSTHVIILTIHEENE